MSFHFNENLYLQSTRLPHNGSRQHTCIAGLATLSTAIARISFPLSLSLNSPTILRATSRNSAGDAYEVFSVPFPLASVKTDFIGPCLFLYDALFFDRDASWDSVGVADGTSRRSKARMTCEANESIARAVMDGMSSYTWFRDRVKVGRDVMPRKCQERVVQLS